MSKANNMPTTIFHLYKKITEQHRYYTALAALCIDQDGEIGVSKFTLDRHDWLTPYENEICVIRKDVAYNTRETREFHGWYEEE